MAEIEAISADGISHFFPDNTDRSVIDRVMKQYAASQPKPESRLARIGHGLADPLYGAAQIGARMEEPTAFSTEEERQARIGTVDTAVQQREADIQKRRPLKDQETMDWYRALGSVPTSAALAAPAAALGPVAGGIVGGAIGAMVQPETKPEEIEHFGRQKATEGVVGGALGVAGVGVGKAAASVYRMATNPAGVALRELQRAAERDGTTIAKLQQALTDAKRIRPDATIADVSGENVRGLVERIGQTPGAGVAKVTPRFTEQQKAQLGRVSEDIGGLTGTKRSAYQAIEGTLAERAATARPLYIQALQEGDKKIWSNELGRLAGSPAVQSAMHAAVTGWQDSAIADGYGALNPRALEGGVHGGGLLDIPTGKVPAFPNLQFWDYTKKALDSMVRGEIKEGKLTERGKTLAQLVQQLRNELDNPKLNVPTYRAARQAWAGPTKYLDAIEEGKGVLSRGVESEELAAKFQQMTEPEKEAYRIGAVSAVRAAMGNDRAKLADMTKYLTSPEMRAKIAAIMPSPEAAEKWLQKLDFEVRRSELTRQALTGSATARRTAQREDADSIAGDMILTALTHEPSLGTLARFKKFVTPKVRDTMRSRSDNILIDLLTTPEGARQIPEQIPQAGTMPLDIASGPLAAGRGSKAREALQ